MWKVKFELLYLWNIETCGEISNIFFHHNEIFSSVKFFRCHSIQILKTQTGFFRLVGVLHALYTVKLSDKYENVLKDVHWNNAYLILGL